jgi:hypothetical protein
MTPTTIPVALLRLASVRRLFIHLCMFGPSHRGLSPRLPCASHMTDR